MTHGADVVSCYDRFGRRQDPQGWYEDAALERLIALGRLAEARAVCEFGCGTGRLAAGLWLALQHEHWRLVGGCRQLDLALSGA